MAQRPEDFLARFGRQIGIDLTNAAAAGIPQTPTPIPSPPISPAPAPMPGPSPMMRQPQAPMPDPSQMAALMQMLGMGVPQQAQQAAQRAPVQAPAMPQTTPNFSGIGQMLQGAQPATMGLQDQAPADPVPDDQKDKEWAVYWYTAPDGTQYQIFAPSDMTPPAGTEKTATFQGRDKVDSAIATGKTIYQMPPDVQSVFLTPETKASLEAQGLITNNPQPQATSEEMQAGTTVSRPVMAGTEGTVDSTGTTVISGSPATNTGRAAIPGEAPATTPRDANGNPIITPGYEVQPDYQTGTSAIPPLTVVDLYGGNKDKGIQPQPEKAMELFQNGIQQIAYNEMVVRQPDGTLKVVPYSTDVPQDQVFLYGPTPVTAPKSFSDGMDVGDFVAAPAKFVLGSAEGAMGAASGVLDAFDMARQWTVTHMAEVNRQAPWLADLFGTVWEQTLPGQIGLGSAQVDLNNWMKEDPERAQYYYEHGYDSDGDGTVDFTGDRAVWEAFVSDKSWYERAWYDISSDPLNMIPGFGEAGKAAGGVIRGGAETIPVWRRVLASTVEGVGAIADVPDRVVEAIVKPVLGTVFKGAGRAINAATGGRAGRLLDTTLRDQITSAASWFDEQIETFRNQTRISDAGGIGPDVPGAPQLLPSGELPPPTVPTDPNMVPQVGPGGTGAPLTPDGGVIDRTVTGDMPPQDVREANPAASKPEIAGPPEPSVIEMGPGGQQAAPTGPEIQTRIDEPTYTQIDNDVRKVTYPDGRAAYEIRNASGTWEPMIRESDAGRPRTQMDPYQGRLPQPDDAPTVNAPAVDRLSAPIEPPPAADEVLAATANPGSPVEVPREWGITKPRREESFADGERRDIMTTARQEADAEPEAWNQFVQIHDAKAREYDQIQADNRQKAMAIMDQTKRERYKVPDAEKDAYDEAGRRRVAHEYARQAMEESHYIVDDLIPDYEQAFGRSIPTEQPMRRRPPDNATPDKKNYRNQGNDALIEVAIFHPKDARARSALEVLRDRATKTIGGQPPQTYLNDYFDEISDMRRRYNEASFDARSRSGGAQLRVGQQVPEPRQAASAPPTNLPAGETPSSRFRSVPTDRVITARERPDLAPEGFDFQMRNADYAEQTVQNIVNDFRPMEFDPITTTPVGDPNDPFYMVMSGHSRREGARRLNLPNVDIRVESGDPKELLGAALRSNTSGTTLRPTERGANITKQMQELGQDLRTVADNEKITRSQAQKFVNTTHLPDDLKALVDNGQMTLEMGSVLGRAIDQKIMSTSELQSFYRRRVLPNKYGHAHVDAMLDMVQRMKVSANVTTGSLFDGMDVGDSGLEATFDRIDDLLAKRRDLRSLERSIKKTASVSDLTPEQQRILAQTRNDVARTENELLSGSPETPPETPRTTYWATEEASEGSSAAETMRAAGANNLFGDSLGIARTDPITDAIFRQVPNIRQEDNLLATGSTQVDRLRGRLIGSDFEEVGNYRFGDPTAEEIAANSTSGRATQDQWRRDVEAWKTARAAPEPVRPADLDSMPEGTRVAAFRKYREDLDRWEAAKIAPQPARPKLSGLSRGETAIERWDRYATELSNGGMEVGEAEKIAQTRVVNDYITDRLKENPKMLERYNSELERLSTRTKDPLDYATAQAQAIWHALMPDTNKALRGYDTVLASLREMALYNTVTGIRYIWTQMVGNIITAILTGNTAAVAEALTPENLRSAYREVRGQPARLLNDSADRMAEDLNIAKMRNNAASIIADPSSTQPVDITAIAGGEGKGPRQTALARSFDKIPLVGKPIGKASAVVANANIRDMASSFDLSFRKALWTTEMDRDISIASRQIRDEALGRVEGWRRGDVTTDQVNDLFDTLEGRDFTGDYRKRVYSSDDIRLTARSRGIDPTFADRIARDWQNTIGEANKRARAEVDRVFFSGQQTNADTFLRRVVMFHYWMSRAYPLYFESLLKNPGYMNAYLNMNEAMRKDAESGDYGPGVKGFVALFATPMGFTVFARPDALVQVFGAFWQESGYDPEGQSLLGKFMDSSGLMFNPIISAVVNFSGAMGDTFAPDPLMLGQEARLATQVIDFAKGKGWLGENVTPTHNWYEEVSGWIRSKTSGEILGTEKIPFKESDVYAQRTINSLIQDIAEERGMDPNSPEVAAAMMDPSSDLYREAFSRYADQQAFDRVAGNVLPTSVLYPKSRPNRPDERNADINSLPDGPEKDALIQERTMANSTDPAATQLYQNRYEYGNLGDSAAEETRRTYNNILFGGLDQQITIGGHIYSSLQINGMDDNQRQRAADLWASENGRRAQIDDQNALRKDYRGDNPEWAETQAWANDVRNYPGGVFAYWQEIDRGGNPNAKRWYDSLSPEEKKNQQVLTSTQAFMAYKGIQSSYRDPAPISVRDNGKIPFSPGETSGSGSTGSGQPKTYTAQDLNDDIAKYQKESAEYKAIVDQEFGPGTDLSAMGPDMEAAAQRRIQEKYGIKAPSIPSVAREYQDWYFAQPPTADRSAEAFIAWRDAQRGNTAAPTVTPETVGQ